MASPRLLVAGDERRRGAFQSSRVGWVGWPAVPSLSESRGEFSLVVDWSFLGQIPWPSYIYIYIHIDNRSNRSWSTKGLQNIFEQTVLVPWGIVSYKHIVMFTMIVMIASIIMTVASVTMIVIMNSMYYGTILIIIDLYCVSAICFPAIYWLVGFLMNASGRFPLGTSAQSKS